MIENIQEYGISIELERKKQVLRDISRVEKAMLTTNRKIARSAQQKFKDEAQAEKIASNVKERIRNREEAEKIRAQQKEAARLARFEDWKLKQFRSTNYQKFSIEQQMNLKRVLSSKKSEHEIREEYARTTAMYRRELAQRSSYARNQARKNKHVSGGSVAGEGVKAGATGGLLALGINPVTAGIAGAVGSGLALRAGSNQFDELQAASATSGLSVQELQKRQMVAQSVAGSEFNVDKLAQMYSDFSEKRGELLADAEIKDGEIKGGGELADSMNLLIKNGVVAPTESAIKEYMSGNVAETIDKMVSDLNRNVDDVNKVRFALEAVSDLGRLNAAIQSNQDKVKAAEATYKNLNIGLTDDETNRLKEFSMAMQSLGAVVTNFPLKLFSGFTESLSPETRELIDRFAQALMKLAQPIGKLLGLVVDLVIKGLSPLIFAVEQLSKIMDPVVESLAAGKRMIEQIFVDLFNSIVDALPDFLIPDSWKSKISEQSQAKTESNNTYNSVNNDNRAYTEKNIEQNQMGCE